MATIIEQIITFTDRAHGTQMRKYTPDRYIVHPVRVMEICKEYSDNEVVFAAALMHDVLEDTPTSIEEIRKFLQPLMGKEKTEETIQLVIELTDVYIKQNYPAWNRRERKQKERERMASISNDAQTIKYADILDNCREIVAHDRSFAKVFLNECLSLMKVMTKGNQLLYKRTMKLLEENLSSLKRK